MDMIMFDRPLKDIKKAYDKAKEKIENIIDKNGRLKEQTRNYARKINQ